MQKVLQLVCCRKVFWKTSLKPNQTTLNPMALHRPNNQKREQRKISLLILCDQMFDFQFCCVVALQTIHWSQIGQIQTRLQADKIRVCVCTSTAQTSESENFLEMFRAVFVWKHENASSNAVQHSRNVADAQLFLLLHFANANHAIVDQRTVWNARVIENRFELKQMRNI
jgi:hypothetical protein